MASRPVKAPFVISTKFGVPDPNALFLYHSGVDYAVAVGTTVYAPTSGTVRYAQLHPVRGNMVGIYDGTCTHRLMHNSKFLVAVGRQVKEGEIVALSGNTGLTTGPHVHHDIIKGDAMDAKTFGDFIDPEVWLTQGEAMTKPSKETLRIIHAFVGGWDIQKALNGDYDDKFSAAAGWKDINSFVYEQFVSNPTWVKDVEAMQQGNSPDTAKADKMVAELQSVLDKYKSK